MQGFVGRALGEPGLKPTVRVGEAALREVAAFLLDYGAFAGVPNTVLVRVRHPIFHRAAAPSGKHSSHPSPGFDEDSDNLSSVQLDCYSSHVSRENHRSPPAVDAYSFQTLQLITWNVISYLLSLGQILQA